MGDLTSTCFTYTVLPTPGAIVTAAGVAVNVGRGADYQILGKVRITRVRASLDNEAAGATAYPGGGGIPLSTAFRDWGMTRNLDYITMIGHGINENPSGLATETPIWELSTPATGGNYVKGYRAVTSRATAGGGLQELATEWGPEAQDWTHVFYFRAYGW